MTQVDSQLMDDMEPVLLDFLQTKVNSFVKWDLVRFFNDNPHAADTAHNIARYIGRDEQMVETELSALVEAEVLQSSHVRGVQIYAMTTAPEIKAMVNQFVAACSDRQFRVKAIYHVIRAMR